MKKFLSLLKGCLLLAGSAALVSSCQDYEPFSEQQVQDVAYDHEFEKIFGKIDPEQTWNLASRATVTVTVDKESEVKVYAIDHGRKTKVADYSNVTGTRTLGFDVVEGTTDIMVTDGVTAQYAKVGDELDFTSALTRTMYNTDLDIISVSDDYREFPYNVINAFTGVIPEEDYTNYKKVTCNFYWVSTGPFTFYPLYWQTASHHKLGIYWIDENGNYQEKDVYADKCGDEVQYPKTYETTTDGEGNPINKGTSWANVGTGNDLYYSDNVTMAGIRSKGITINLPKGQVFGMYIKVYNTQNTYNSSTQMYEFTDGTIAHKVFSEESKNAHMLKDYGGMDWQSVSGMDDKPVHASTFQAIVDGTLYTYFGFEDYYFGPDLNDLIFVFGDNVPTVVDEDTGQEWVLAYEDLGNSFDWDYNDVVLSVGHVSGYTTAKITPLAAGGTLASNIYFNNQDLGEIHQLFGQSATTSGNYTPVNIEDRGNIGMYQNVTVSEDFSMTALSDYEIGSSDKVSDHSGIVIKVTPKGGGAQEAADIVYSLANKGAAPEVFCIPRKWETQEPTEEGGTTTRYWREWRWPKEYANIDLAYSKFASWASDRTNNEWYKEDPVLAQCVTGTFDFTSTTTTELGESTSYASNSAIHIVSKNVKLVKGRKYNLSAFFTTESTGTIHYRLADNNTSSQITDNTTNLYVSGTAGATFKLDILQESDENNDQCNGVVNITIVESDMAKDFAEGDDMGATSLAVTEPATMTYTDNSGHETTYSNTTFIDFSSVTASEGATATLCVTFNDTPNTSFYMDYADASQLYEDFFSYDKTAVTYSLDADQLAYLLSNTNSDGQKGIYFVGFNDAAVDIASAKLVISGGGSSGGSTTEGLTLSSESESINWGYAYKVTVADGTFDTTKGGKIKVTYSGAPASGQSIFLCDSNSENQKAMNGDGTSTSYTFELTQAQIAAYSSGFYVGIWNPAGLTVTSVIYEANE